MRRVALLRGINVGGRNKVPMAALKHVFEEAGASNIETYIQSGNVVFDAPATLNAKQLETAIEKYFQLKIDVTVRTTSQLKALVANNPYDPAFTHVGFCSDKPKKADLDKVDVEGFAPEGFTPQGDDVYLHLPSGMGNSKFVPHFTRRARVPMTVRNWNTVTRLYELSR